MLRITVHNDPQMVTLQLEGKLEVSSLKELEECWQSIISGQRNPRRRVDLTAVTFIDDAGKVSLAAMHQQGAELIATDCVTKEIVREILEDASQTTAGEMKLDSRTLLRPRHRS